MPNSGVSQLEGRVVEGTSTLEIKHQSGASGGVEGVCNEARAHLAGVTGKVFGHVEVFIG